MRDYFKCYRTPDGKTVLVDLAPGDDPDNYDLLACFMAKPRLWVPPLYNLFAGVDQWLGSDADGNPIYFNNGLTLANNTFDLRPYSDHPEN